MTLETPNSAAYYLVPSDAFRYPADAQEESTPAWTLEEWAQGHDDHEEPDPFLDYASHSDGQYKSYSVGQIVKFFAEFNIGTFTCTDHDTLKMPRDPRGITSIYSDGFEGIYAESVDDLLSQLNHTQDLSDFVAGKLKLPVRCQAIEFYRCTKPAGQRKTFEPLDGLEAIGIALGCAETLARDTRPYLRSTANPECIHSHAMQVKDLLSYGHRQLSAQLFCEAEGQS